MTHSPSLLITLLLATLLPQITLGRLAPVSEFCSLKQCPSPKTDLVGMVNGHLDKTFGTGSPKCGDGICNISQGEDCSNCSQDCGSCELFAPYTKCVKPNQMALTFDDGPSQYSLKLLKFLKEANVKATFFTNAIYLLGKESTLKRVLNDGHIIGSHTYSHRSLDNGHTAGGEYARDFDSLESSHMQSELFLNDAVIHSAIGKLPRFVRPPFLETSAESLAFMETAGYVPVNINVDSQDWKLGTTEAIFENTLKELDAVKGQGSWIHLQHELQEYSVDAVPQIIKAIQAKGIKLVTLDECLGLPAYRDDTDSPFLSKEAQSKVTKNAVTVASYAKASPAHGLTPAPVVDNSKSQTSPKDVVSDTPTNSESNDNVFTPPQVKVPITRSDNVSNNAKSETTTDSAEANKMTSSSSVSLSQDILLTIFIALCSIIIA